MKTFEEHAKLMLEGVTEFRFALNRESDRGCALFATSFLDHELKLMLEKWLVDDSAANKDLFGYGGPLGTFSSRILIAYSMGLISSQVRREIDLIRKIRNDFGHSPVSIGFDEQSISGRINALSFSWKDSDATARQHFTACVCYVLGVIRGSRIRAVTPEVKEGDAIQPKQMKEFRDATYKIFGNFHKEAKEKKSNKSEMATPRKSSD